MEMQERQYMAGPSSEQVVRLLSGSWQVVVLQTISGIHTIRASIDCDRTSMTLQAGDLHILQLLTAAI